MKIRLLVILCASLGFGSCGIKSSVYEKRIQIPGNKWAAGFKPTFKFGIDDIKARYKMSLLVRHDESYPDANIMFNVQTKTPGDSVYRNGQRIEKVMTDSAFVCQAGVWKRAKTGATWEEYAISPEEMPEFAKTGVYEIQIAQLMRDSLLPGVLNVGLRVEKL